MKNVPSTLSAMILLAVFLCLGKNSSLALVLNVPAEFATIQAALDSAATGDTVRVAPGSYHEFLSSPTNSLTLLGWYPADTLEELRTILDPIPGGVDTPSVAVFSGDTVRIKNFAFFNRRELRQPESATRTGGVRHFGASLNLTNCRFDSVSKCVYGGDRIEARRCVFEGCSIMCLYPTNYGSIKADNCSFDGTGYLLVQGFSGSQISNCSFHRGDTGGTYLLSLFGIDLTVSGCTFGPSGRGFSPVYIYTEGNCLVEDCVFANMGRSPSLLDIRMDCPGPGGVPITIRRNIFRDYSGEGIASGPTALKLICEGAPLGYFGIIEDNHFINGSPSGTAIPGIYLNGGADLIHNTFENLHPSNVPDVRVMATTNDTVIARNNSFLEPGIAILSNGPYFDARENWWGDSTGPYNGELNPEGQGTQVGNAIRFIPWLTMHPDSLPDTNGVAVDQHDLLLPNEYSMSVYPNPFNASATLSIDVSVPGFYNAALFDITGRHVATLFSGQIRQSRTLQFSGDRLATGVYIAQLSQAGKSVAQTKLLLLK